MGGSPTSRRRKRLVFVVEALAAFLIPAIAFRHIERASYWPDPAPEQAGGKMTGGEVPNARTLKSAVKLKRKKGKASAQSIGTTRVVCKANSFKLLKASIQDALRNGYDIRPTDHENFTKKEARKLKRINRKLLRK